MYSYLCYHFLKFFQAFLLILNNFHSTDIYHRYFSDISDISVKLKYRYIRKNRYFNPWTHHPKSCDNIWRERERKRDVYLQTRRRLFIDQQMLLGSSACAFGLPMTCLLQRLLQHLCSCFFSSALIADPPTDSSTLFVPPCPDWRPTKSIEWDGDDLK